MYSWDNFPRYLNSYLRFDKFFWLCSKCYILSRLDWRLIGLFSGEFLCWLSLLFFYNAELGLFILFSYFSINLFKIFSSFWIISRETTSDYGLFLSITVFFFFNVSWFLLRSYVVTKVNDSFDWLLFIYNCWLFLPDTSKSSMNTWLNCSSSMIWACFFWVVDSMHNSA